jgi:hypothetical protein
MNAYAMLYLDSTVQYTHRSRYWKWKEVTAHKIRALVAAQMGMGLSHKPTLDSYFQNMYWLTQTPGFFKIFSTDQYQLLQSFLHFSDMTVQPHKGAENYDSFFKIRLIIDLTKDTYMDVFGCGKEVSTDESMSTSKGVCISSSICCKAICQMRYKNLVAV